MQYVLRVHAHKKEKKKEEKKGESHWTSVFFRILFIYTVPPYGKRVHLHGNSPPWTFPLKGRRVQIRYSISRQEKD